MMHVVALFVVYVQRANSMTHKKPDYSVLKVSLKDFLAGLVSDIYWSDQLDRNFFFVR